MVGPLGFEPRAYGLKGRCSTVELWTRVERLAGVQFSVINIGCCPLLLGERPDCEALLSDCDTCTASKVQTFRNLTAGLDIIGNTESNHFWHPGFPAVPVNLEPLGIPLVQIISCDEVKADSVSVGADTLNYDLREAGLRMGSKCLGRSDIKGVTSVCGGSHNDLRGLG